MLSETLALITIRAASNDDREQVFALVSSVLKEHGLEPDLETTDSDLRDIEANYFARGGIFEIIEDHEANLLGSIGIYPLDQTTCELRKMYFVARIRGLGLGKHILQRAIDRARQLGFKRMVLETSSKLEAANNLYFKFGFRPVSSDHLASRADRAFALDL
jgi:putative acetyltransferase